MRAEGVGDGAGDWSTRVDGERTATGAGGRQRRQKGACEKRCENEANLCDDVCIVQPQEVVEVPANSGGVSGVDGCQTNPIFLETKPISAGGEEAGGAGGSTTPEARPLTEREQRDAWKEIRRREWLRSRAEKEAGSGSGWRGWTRAVRTLGRIRRSGGSDGVAGCAGAVSECGDSCTASGSLAGGAHPPGPPFARGGKGRDGALAGVCCAAMRTDPDGGQFQGPVCDDEFR